MKKILRACLLILVFCATLTPFFKKDALTKKRSINVPGKQQKPSLHTRTGNDLVSDDPEAYNLNIQKWYRTIAEVITSLEERCYRKIDMGEFVKTMLKAGVASIDPHSSFLPNIEDVTNATSGKFSGIGISTISKSNEEDFLFVVDVVSDSPAQKAGIIPGDKIVEIGGEKLRGLSADEAVNLIRGKIGTTTTLKVMRNKKPLSFVVTRAVIKEQSSTCYYFPNHKTYYLGLKIFSELAPKQMKKLLIKATAEHCNGIILDLRNNPGGVLEAAVEMAGLFLPKHSKIVTTKNNIGAVIQEYQTTTNPILTNSIPIFILINNFTASASEILAGALKHYSAQTNPEGSITPTVIIVGTTSFGKGSVQEVSPISNGCALKQTTMLYYLPDDTSIQAKGIEPDIIIQPKTTHSQELQWIHEFYGKETSLKHHITQNEIEKNARKEFPGFAQEIDKKIETEQNLLEAEHEKKVKKEESLKKKSKQEFDAKKLEDIENNSLVQGCLNMIGLLKFRNYPEIIGTDSEIKSRTDTINFLKTWFAHDNGLNLIKIEEIQD